MPPAYPGIDGRRSGGAVGFGYRDYFLYVEGVDPWPDDSERVIKVTGILDARYDDPVPGHDSAGRVIVAAGYCPRYVLTKTRVLNNAPTSTPSTRLSAGSR
jgi:hypothetical protein